ncbi:fimbria/pilus outer membrane usher protein [Caballeronia sp. LP003]|uniref:fimbria/pilus outer membrane usher protein n=1 Tax=Caballeronia sp. LP003 TaxID=3038551 RepID=UPI0028637A9C|nr:fimbria/pilus outer membrane usher protein [Caballeronia sp. LP003]MDR5785384.1 fimbria/pilus outer membrane usher protein [Caballeronia sp. LP003]
MPVCPVLRTILVLASCAPVAFAASSRARAAEPASHETGKLLAVSPGEDLVVSRDAPPAGSERYLEVAINGVSTQQIAQFFMTDNMLSTTLAELRDLGLRADDLKPDAQGRIALDLVPGLRYTYRPESQRIDIEAADARRVPAALGNAPARAPTAATGTGLVINYEASAQATSPMQYGLYTEERFFYPGGVFDNSGTAYWHSGDAATGGGRRYVRLDTFWSRSDAASLVTTRLGDTISSSLTWTRPVRMGGAQLSRDFGLRPDLVTYPVPALSGSAAVPSAVDLYVNNVRQFSGAAPSGPFVINAVPAINGAGEAVIVSRDVLGRSVMTTVPLYIDARLLARGLTDFSVEAGFVRRAYALRSFDYAGDPSISASMRRGLTDELTLEAHGEATLGVFNAGAGVLYGIGQAGVFNASVAASAGNGGDRPSNRYLFPGGFAGAYGQFAFGNTQSALANARAVSVASQGGSGVQLSAGWQWHTPALSIDLQAQKATPHYSDLASAEGTPVPRTTYRATIAAPVRALGALSTASASFVGLNDPIYGDSNIGSLAYTVTLSGSTSLSASVYHDFGDTRNTGFFATLSFPLGGALNGSVNVGSDQGKLLFGAAVAKTADYGGGLGWQLQTSRQNGMQQALAQAAFRGRYGDMLATAVNAQSRVYGELDASGSIVVMEHDVLAGRRIDDAFALVDTDGVAGVPVLHENREIGRTNGGGHLLVPDLVAYQANHLAIDPLPLPVDTAITTTQLNLAPQSRAGVLARFPLHGFRGAQIQLLDARGAPLPPGTTLVHRETGKRYVVGYDGLAFIDDLGAGNTLQATLGDTRCEASVPFEARGHGLPTLGPFACEVQR